jgi:dUTP pyrophosphatase
MKLKIRILDQRIHNHSLSYGTPGSAAFDLRACLWNEYYLQPGEVKAIGVGVAIHIGDPGYAAIICPRSGMGTKGLVMGNTIGLIDSDYQGELTVQAWNRSNNEIRIDPMDRIAQLFIVPVVQVEFDVVDDFVASERGTGGYGSTGVK